MIKRILETGAIHIPWPINIDGEAIKSKYISVHKKCEKCEVRECLLSGAAGDSVCFQGLSYYSSVVGGSRIVTYGLIGADKTRYNKDKSFRAISKGRAVVYTDFLAWISKIKELESVLSGMHSEVFEDVMHSFHDTIKWSNQIYSISKKSIFKGGENRGAFKESFDAATNDQKLIFKASQSLINTFDTAEIYLNPESVSYGVKRSIEVYKLIHKIQIILQSGEASSRNIKIRLNKGSYNMVDVYESFNLLPLSLIQNAIKYSSSGEVYINVDDIVGGIFFSVNNIGPYIPIEERRRIFEKGYRSSCAKKMHHDGIGAGLFVAREVALAHGIDVVVQSDDLGYSQSGIQQAKNEFSFEVLSYKEIST